MSTFPDVDSKDLPPDWALWPLVRGRRALMMGGDPREQRRARLEKTFQFASLDWPVIDGPRHMKAVLSRIQRGTVDLLIVLQPFVDHKQCDPAIETAKAYGVAWVLSEGYGASAIVRALERFHSHTKGGA